ncbi:MAG: hypothetical protein AB2L24_08990 [Mangrovibacterium sp.]
MKHLKQLKKVIHFCYVVKLYSTSLGGLAFIVLGAFLIIRANKNKEDEEKKKQWEEGTDS